MKILKGKIDEDRNMENLSQENLECLDVYRTIFTDI